MNNISEWYKCACIPTSIYAHENIHTRHSSNLIPVAKWGRSYWNQYRYQCSQPI